MVLDMNKETKNDSIDSFLKLVYHILYYEAFQFKGCHFTLFDPIIDH